MKRRGSPKRTHRSTSRNQPSGDDRRAPVARGESKRQGSQQQGTQQQGPADAHGQPGSHPGSGAPSGGGSVAPSDAVRTLLSIWLPLHLMALFVSFSAVVEPSSIHARLHSLMRPYLQLTHFDADDRPLYLAHGDSSEQPHRLQVTTAAISDIDSAEGESQWRTIAAPSPAGFAASDRYGRWLATAATLAESEQPSLVAELLLPIVQADESIQAVRIVRLPTDLNTTLDDSLPPPFTARVIREAGQVSLVQLQEARLSAVTGSMEGKPND